MDFLREYNEFGLQHGIDYELEYVSDYEIYFKMGGFSIRGEVLTFGMKPHLAFNLDPLGTFWWELSGKTAEENIDKYQKYLKVISSLVNTLPGSLDVEAGSQEYKTEPEYIVSLEDIPKKARKFIKQVEQGK